MVKDKQTPQWQNSRGWALITALVALVAAYLIGSRGLDTGSWQQYFLTFVLLVFGLSRLFRSIRPKKVN
jgi:hypothetical protein